MTERERDTKGGWIDPDDAPEWPDEVWDRAQISVGGKVVREATGTLTRRGRPPLGQESKQQVTLRLAPDVVRYFRESGSGWQTRLNAVLERHVDGRTGEPGKSMSRAVTRYHAMAKNEDAGKKASTAASKALKSAGTGKVSKTAAASEITQRPSRKR